ncbi:MAG: alginate lyase family protein [Terriglobia bacterium]
MRRREFLVTSGLAFAAPTAAPQALIPSTASSRRSVPGFVHPGIYQTRQNLDFMKGKILAKDQPWSGVWERFLGEPESSLSFSPAPVTHIFRGPYGRGAVGDLELQTSVRAADAHMLRWIVSGDRAHAEKAIEILNAWSETLWDFDGNDAKLLAGWTGASLCNTAEILRSTYRGWGSGVDERFRGLMTGVYVPLLRDFFPTANGNWDGAIMQTLAAIGIYCDDRSLFDAATEHFLYGVANGGITKYVYPNGQCEETDRDQGHTQLGLGAFSLMALVAWNQNVDLFSAAGNRLALGFEYTSKYMLGGDVPYFGDISARGRGRFANFYEVAYEHYRFVKGMKMPHTEQAVQRAREEGTRRIMTPEGVRSTLTFYRGNSGRTQEALLPAPALDAGMPAAGAQLGNSQAPPGAVVIPPGSSIRAALTALAEKGGGQLFLDEGLHITPLPLRIPSNVTITGRGRTTVLSLSPQATGYCIVEGGPALRNVVLRDFILEGGVSYTPPADPNQEKRNRSTELAPARGGIRLQADKAGEFSGIRMERLTVRNCTMAGVAIAGAQDLVIENCDFSDNGGKVAPGPGQHHNLEMKYVSGARVHGSRLDGSMAGCGLHVRKGSNVSVVLAEAARNAQSGMCFVDCERVTVERSMVEGNDRLGIDVRPRSKAKTAASLSGNVLQVNGSDLLRRCLADKADLV